MAHKLSTKNRKATEQEAVRSTWKTQISDSGQSSRTKRPCQGGSERHARRTENSEGCGQETIPKHWKEEEVSDDGQAMSSTASPTGSDRSYGSGRPSSVGHTAIDRAACSVLLGPFEEITVDARRVMAGSLWPMRCARAVDTRTFPGQRPVFVVEVAGVEQAEGRMQKSTSTPYIGSDQVNTVTISCQD